MKRKKNIITCPYCGAEYFPEEIFIPDAVFNKHLNVIKDEDNKIIYSDNGESFNLSEIFICDACDKEFRVEADVKFKCVESINEKDPFDEAISVKL